MAFDDKQEAKSRIVNFAVFLIFVSLISFVTALFFSIRIMTSLREHTTLPLSAVGRRKKGGDDERRQFSFINFDKLYFLASLRAIMSTALPENSSFHLSLTRLLTLNPPPHHPTTYKEPKLYSTRLSLSPKRSALLH